MVMKGQSASVPFAMKLILAFIVVATLLVFVFQKLAVKT